MQKLKMKATNALTFKEGCEKYLEYCRQRNLREGTIAKQWILSGGNVVSLSQLLGNSSLDITQNYIHLLVSDISKLVDEINILDKFQSRKHISMRK